MLPFTREPGCLLLESHAVPRRLLLIPMLWAVVGGSAALLLDMPQDWVLGASGIALLALLWRQRQPNHGRTFA